MPIGLAVDGAHRNDRKLMRATSERKAFPQRGDARWAIAIPKRAKYHFALQTARSTATCTESIPKRALRRARSPPGQCRRAIGWSDPALLERIQLNSPFSLTAQEPLAPRLRACAPDLPGSDRRQNPLPRSERQRCSRAQRKPLQPVQDDSHKETPNAHGNPFHAMNFLQLLARYLPTR